MLVEKTNLEFFSKRARMHLTCTLRARAIAQPPDIGIQFFQLISSISCKDKLFKLRRQIKNFFLSVHACTLHASCVHGLLHSSLTLEFNFFN